MKNKNILFGTLVISVLLILSVFSGTAIKMNTTTLTGTLEVTKKIWDGDSWVDEIEADLNDTVQFKITVTYYNQTAGHHYAYNLTITDILPSCLEYIAGSADPFEPTIDGNHLIWHPDQTVLYDEDSYVVTFNATVVDCGENINAVEVGADEYCTGQYLTAEDTATVDVNCPPPEINVEKYIWDGYCDWIKEIHVYSGDTVRFKIVVENTGGVDLTNVTVLDVLSHSLEYADQATVNGEPCEPAISENGTTLTWVFDSLNVSETIIIEFNAVVVGLPCEEDTNWVYVTGEVSCNEKVRDKDSAKVFINGMCMEKEVWNDEAHGWMEETTVEVGKLVNFRITVFYHGPYKLYTIRVWDVLPPCLSYADDATVNGELYEPEISSDGKILWWNLSSDYNLYDGDNLVIKFNALASENNCQPCVNWAYIIANECSGNILNWSDPATVYIECAYVADAGGPYYGDVDEDITITGSATGGAPPYSYAWDMDNDGNFDDATGKTVTWSWSEPGDYVIRLQVTDNDDEKAYDYAYVSIVAPTNNPPNKPSKPSGPSSGKSGIEYTYSTSTTDSDGDQVMYMFDWGDGSTSGWLGPYDSGVTVQAKHVWSEQGSYEVKVKAKDMPHFESSAWSDSLSVSISKSRAFFKNPLLLEFLNKLLERFPIFKNLI
ncbi:MAG: hypothetical protein DRN33_03070 [Thermoplasmata archaeon]|nr:MAG: hypothetical protein DRN33_03070 [Thermoplasmata archaeon]